MQIGVVAYQCTKREKIKVAVKMILVGVNFF